MAVFSKLGKIFDTNPRNLCCTVIYVYSERVVLRNIIRLCKVPNRSVRELLDFLHQKQKLLVESCKDKLVESHERAQITRLIGEYLNCLELAQTYTDWELQCTIHARFFETGRSIGDLVQTYGVPIRTIFCHVKKVLKNLGGTTLKEMQRRIRDRDVIREEVKQAIEGLLITKKRGRPTQLTRDEEALMVAKAELEAVHGFPVNRRELGHRLNDLVRELSSANNQMSKINDKSKSQYARCVVQRINLVEPGIVGQKKKTKTGEINVAGLSHKRAKKVIQDLPG